LDLENAFKEKEESYKELHKK